MISGHFEGPNRKLKKMTILLLRSLTNSGQIHDQAGLPVPDTIHFSPILDVNMFVRMYV